MLDISPNNYVSEADASGNRPYRGSDVDTHQFLGLSACNGQSLLSRSCLRHRRLTSFLGPRDILADIALRELLVGSMEPGINLGIRSASFSPFSREETTRRIRQKGGLVNYAFRLSYV